MLQRNTQIFACGIGGTLVLIFILELAQMNINKWGDSWGAGCVIGAIGFTLRKSQNNDYFFQKLVPKPRCLVQHWYSLERHRQKISNSQLRFSDSEEPKSYQFGLLRKLGGIVCLVLYLSSFTYQFLQMFLWPTVWKENRYFCPTASPLNSSATPFNVEITGLTKLTPFNIAGR